MTVRHGVWIFCFPKENKRNFSTSLRSFASPQYEFLLLQLVCESVNARPHQKQGYFVKKKNLGENMKRFSETSTRLPIKHFRKKLVQKILNGFGHTDVREIMLSKKFVCILIELRVHKRNEHQVWLFTVSWSFGDNKILQAEELILTKNKKFRDQINFRNQTCSN